MNYPAGINISVAVTPEQSAILTPHIAWSGRAAMQALADQLIANIEAYAAGTPQNRVA